MMEGKKGSGRQVTAYEPREDSRKGRGEQKRVKGMGMEEVIRPAEATAHQVVSDS